MSDNCIRPIPHGHFGQKSCFGPSESTEDGDLVGAAADYFTCSFCKTFGLDSLLNLGR